jgi:RecA-family ATPase
VGSPQLDGGFITELERWRTSVKDPRFVVIDVLQRIKPAGSMARNSYENDYSAWAELQRWATKHGIAVLGLHHTRKGGADDPLEALSGSNGLSAVADTTLVLDSDQNGKTLYVRGRDVEEKETALIFTAGLWSILGEAADVRRTSERSKILSALLTADERCGWRHRQRDRRPKACKIQTAERRH